MLICGFLLSFHERKRPKHRNTGILRVVKHTLVQIKDCHSAVRTVTVFYLLFHWSPSDRQHHDSRRVGGGVYNGEDRIHKLTLERWRASRKRWAKIPTVIITDPATFLFWIKPNPTPPASLGDTWGSGGYKGGGDNKGCRSTFSKMPKRRKTSENQAKKRR